MTTRRGLLAAMLGAAVAPVFIPSTRLMRVTPRILVPGYHLYDFIHGDPWGYMEGKLAPPPVRAYRGPGVCSLWTNQWRELRDDGTPVGRLLFGIPG